MLNGLVRKGQDFFRSAVIEALGDYKGAYALANLTEVAKLDGPLQDDAVLALGKIGDKASLALLAGLQRTAPRAVQPTIAAAICLLGVNCSSHLNYLDEIAALRRSRTPGSRTCSRAAASGLGAVAARREPGRPRDARRSGRAVARSGARAGRARARRRRPAQHAARA